MLASDSAVKPRVPGSHAEIDAAWFTQALRAGGLDVTVAAISAHPIVQNVGLQGEIVRYGLTYAGDRQGPGSVVAKLPTLDPANRRHSLSASLWDRETGFYRDIAPRVGVRVPKCLYVGAEPQREAYAILLEDLDGRQQPAHVSAPRAAAAMRWLAALHGRWWGKADGEFPWLETERSFERRMRERVEANWPAFLVAAQASRVPARQIAMVEASVARFGEGLTGGLLTPTLIHYDYRVGNMLYDGDDDLVVLDWQSPLVGQGTADLGWFLKDSISPADRAAHGTELVRLYLDNLVQHGVDRRDLEPFERQLRLSQLRRLPMSVLSATTFANLAHADDAGGPVWWARDYDELEAIWRSDGRAP